MKIQNIYWFSDLIFCYIILRWLISSNPSSWSVVFYFSILYKDDNTWAAHSLHRKKDLNINISYKCKRTGECNNVIFCNSFRFSKGNPASVEEEAWFGGGVCKARALHTQINIRIQSSSSERIIKAACKRVGW
jgi:hypothetical protein